MSDPLDVRSFETRFRQLLAGFQRDTLNHGSIECVRCVGCNHCTFCQESEQLLRCHFCTRCKSSSDSSHCRDSSGLVNCQHCIQCENCASSSYLTKCLSVTNCSYCFGCVGLNGQDFQILNQPYSRKEYFEITRRLAKGLRL